MSAIPGLDFFNNSVNNAWGGNFLANNIASNVGDAVKSASSDWLSGVVDKLGGIGGIAKAGGAIAGAIGSYKSAKEANKLARDQFNYNKSLNDMELKRRADADKSLSDAWANSAYAKA